MTCDSYKTAAGKLFGRLAGIALICAFLFIPAVLLTTTASEAAVWEIVKTPGVRLVIPDEVADGDTLLVTSGSLDSRDKPAFYYVGTTFHLRLADQRSDIPEDLFNGNSKILSITADELAGVTMSIGKKAFYDCNSLTTVSMPNVDTIGSNAFQGCSALATVSMTNAKTIKSYAFQGCSALTTVSMPNVEIIESYAFQGCSVLTTVSMTNVETIDKYAFQGCSKLTAVSMPNVETIESYAFQNCKSLKSIALPKVESIESLAFQGADKLDLLILPDHGNVTVDNNAFKNVKSNVAILSANAGAYEDFGGLKETCLIEVATDGLASVEHGYVTVAESGTITIANELNAFGISGVYWERNGTRIAALDGMQTVTVDESGEYSMFFSYNDGLAGSKAIRRALPAHRAALGPELKYNGKGGRVEIAETYDSSAGEPLALSYEPTGGRPLAPLWTVNPLSDDITISLDSEAGKLTLAGELPKDGKSYRFEVSLTNDYNTWSNIEPLVLGITVSPAQIDVREEIAQVNESDTLGGVVQYEFLELTAEQIEAIEEAYDLPAGSLAQITGTQSGSMTPLADPTADLPPNAESHYPSVGLNIPIGNGNLAAFTVGYDDPAAVLNTGFHYEYATDEPYMVKIIGGGPPDGLYGWVELYTGKAAWASEGVLYLNYVVIHAEGDPKIVGDLLVIPDLMIKPDVLTDPLWLVREKGSDEEEYPKPSSSGCAGGAATLAALAALVPARRRMRK